jgi:N-acetylglucosaminyldiphosphoundecaprenol N-acetyl-beta-D-mannosaminyltransferase
MGMPKQELWAQRMVERLSPTVILATGAMFVWYTGTEIRKRNWLTDHGFEWLTRYVQHPVRHFRRYVLGNPLFLFRIVRQRYTGKCS